MSQQQPSARVHQFALNLSMACGSLESSLAMEGSDEASANSGSSSTSSISSYTASEGSETKAGPRAGRRRRRNRAKGTTGYATDRSSSPSIGADNNEPAANPRVKRRSPKAASCILPVSMNTNLGRHPQRHRSPALSFSTASQGGKAALSELLEAYSPPHATRRSHCSLDLGECAAMCEMFGGPQLAADQSSSLAGTPTALSARASPRHGTKPLPLVSSKPIANARIQRTSPLAAILDVITTSSSDGPFTMPKGIRVTRSPSRLSWAVPTAGSDPFPTTAEESIDSQTEFVAALRKGSGHSLHSYYDRPLGSEEDPHGPNHHHCPPHFHRYKKTFHAGLIKAVDESNNTLQYHPDDSTARLSTTAPMKSETSPPHSLADSLSQASPHAQTLPTFYGVRRAHYPSAHAPLADSQMDSDHSTRALPPPAKPNKGLTLVTYGLNGSMTGEGPHPRGVPAYPPKGQFPLMPNHLRQPSSVQLSAVMSPSSGHLPSSVPQKHRRRPSGFGSSTTSFVSSATFQKERARVADGNRFNINEIIPNELYLCAAKTLVIDPLVIQAYREQLSNGEGPATATDGPVAAAPTCRVCDDLELTAFLCVADEVDEIEIIRPHVHHCYRAHLRAEGRGHEHLTLSSLLEWSQRVGFTTDPNASSTFHQLEAENKAMLSNSDDPAAIISSNTTSNMRSSPALSRAEDMDGVLASALGNNSKIAKGSRFFGIKGTRTNNNRGQDAKVCMSPPGLRPSTPSTRPINRTGGEQEGDDYPMPIELTCTFMGGSSSSSQNPYPVRHVRSTSLIGGNESSIGSGSELRERILAAGGCTTRETKRGGAQPTYTLVSATRHLTPQQVSAVQLPVPAKVSEDTLSQGADSCLTSPKPPRPTNAHKGFPLPAYPIGHHRAPSHDPLSPSNISNTHHSSGYTTPRPHQMLPQVFINNQLAMAVRPEGSSNASHGTAGQGTSSSGTQNSTMALIPLHPISPRMANVSPPPALASPTYPIIRVCHLPMSDTSDSGNFSRLQSEAFAFIEHCRSEGRKVVVFCRESKSRSPSTVIAYLMRRYHWGFRKSIRHESLERERSAAARAEDQEQTQQQQRLLNNQQPTLRFPPAPATAPRQYQRPFPLSPTAVPVEHSSSSPLSPLTKREDTLIPETA